MSDLTDADVFVQVIDGEDIQVQVEETEPVMFAFMSEQGPEGIQGQSGDAPVLIHHVVQFNLATGTLSESTIDSLTDGTASWTPGEFVGKVVRVIDSGTAETLYRVVVGNDLNTLFVDQAFGFAPEIGSDFTVLDTIEIPDNNYKTVVCVDSNSNPADCAVLLPPVSGAMELSSVVVYPEWPSVDVNDIILVAAIGDTVRGNHTYKPVFAAVTRPSLKLVQHNTVSPHWDIV
jgi:hypothetical protein